MADDRQPEPDRPTPAPVRPRAPQALWAAHVPTLRLPPVVIGSSIDMARFFLKMHDLAFIDRPRTETSRYTGYNYSDMLWSPYGAYWRQARKFCKAEVFSVAWLRSQEHV
ncbi:unnamed protein product [Miscanthus lutarioriparius]|uniref:Uncharacterized protein n=1 Tax=Miscanthus lutarioriparius TaxID=422564 RepID=A0A811NBZ2_9POAL|nr:unnamed protein product [Miscanthus lutarioriparius]